MNEVKPVIIAIVEPIFRWLCWFYDFPALSKYLTSEIALCQ